MIATATSTRHLRQTSILVVEDNPDHWAIIQAALRECLPNVEPVWAPDAASALTYLDERVSSQLKLPRLILLDLYLPQREESIYLLQQLKNPASPFHQPPVVVLTHSTSPHDIRELYEAGASSYIVKPTDGAQWLACFKTIKEYWWDVATLPHEK